MSNHGTYKVILHSFQQIFVKEIFKVVEKVRMNKLVIACQVHVWSRFFYFHLTWSIKWAIWEHFIDRIMMIMVTVWAVSFHGSIQFGMIQWYRWSENQIKKTLSKWTRKRLRKTTKTGDQAIFLQVALQSVKGKGFIVS